jgi:hypothetical protein
MNKIKFLALSAIAAIAFAPAAPKAAAQISFNVGIGVAPACPYGYYDYSPYGCAPYGYYGPEWFRGGIFIGAGPWFHGPDNFHGYVNNRYDRQHGYNGHFPNNGDRATRRDRAPMHFKGNEVRDGRGHVGGENGDREARQ